MSSIHVKEDHRGVSYIPLTYAMGGPHELKPATPGKRHRIVAGMLSFATAGTLDLRSNATSLFGGPMAFGDTGGFVVPAFETFLQTEEGEALNLVSTGVAPRGVFKVVTE